MSDGRPDHWRSGARDRLQDPDDSLLRGDRADAGAAALGGQSAAVWRRALARLGFVRNSRDLGFSQAAIRELLALADHPDQPCDAVDAIARRHLREIEQRIARLSALHAELERVLAQCARGKIADCNILDSLANRAENEAASA